MTPDETYALFAVITGVIATVLWTIYFVRHGYSCEIEFVDVFAGLVCGIVTGIMFPIALVVAAVALVAAIIFACIKLLNRVVWRHKSAKSTYTRYWHGPNGGI